MLHFCLNVPESSIKFYRVLRPVNHSSLLYISGGDGHFQLPPIPSPTIQSQSTGPAHPGAAPGAPAVPASQAPHPLGLPPHAQLAQTGIPRHHHPEMAAPHAPPPHRAQMPGTPTGLPSPGHPHHPMAALTQQGHPGMQGPLPGMATAVHGPGALHSQPGTPDTPGSMSPFGMHSPSAGPFPHHPPEYG